MNNLINNFKNELEKISTFFKNELQRLRTGRASPLIVEDILVDCYNTKMKLKQVAAISCPEHRQILIQPWDRTNTEHIVKALSASDLGTSPIVDKQFIRINLPSLTEEFRKNLITQTSRKEEESREAIRKWRDHFLKELQKQFQEKQISEDDKFRTKDEIQKIVDEYNKKLADSAKLKEKEILES